MMIARPKRHTRPDRRAARPKARSAMVSDVPPCEPLVNPQPQWQQTYVVMGGTEAGAASKTYALAKAVDGAGMWAIHQARHEIYLVITLGKGGCERSHFCHFCH